MTDYSDLLPLLRFHLREDTGGNGEGCACGSFTDSQLLLLLEKHGGDVRAASYEGLLMKAEEDGVRLPDGLDLPSGRDYWLSLASLYRPCRGQNVRRADEVFDDE